MYESVPCFNRLASSAFHDFSHKGESSAWRAARRERGLVAVSPGSALGCSVLRQNVGICQHSASTHIEPLLSI